MKKIIHKPSGPLLIILIVSVMAVFSACKKDMAANPIITSIRSYVPAPGDSLLSKIGSGQWVVITGAGLRGATQILFDGVNASFNEALFSDTTAVVLVPTIPYNNVPVDQINTIRYITTQGETIFSFTIAPPPPTISGMSNENAVVGDTATIFGANFFYIQSINYGGSLVTVYKASNNGTSIGIRVPVGLNLAQSAPLVVVTSSGTATTTYPVNVSTGPFMLFNFDGIGGLDAGQNNAPRENDPMLFPGNRGNYMRMNPGVVPANDFGYRNGKRLLWSVPTPWIPAANMADPIDSWALKFEIYCQKPFANGVIYIEPSTGTWFYANRFEPWKTTPGFKPNGWTTMTIPFNQFLASLNGNNGTGAAPPTMNDFLVKNIQASGPVMRFNLCGSTAAADLDFAIDNVRCVKIK